MVRVARRPALPHAFRPHISFQRFAFSVSFPVTKSCDKSYDKSYGQLRPCTANTVRILLRYTPFILYNLWLLVRFLTCRQTGIVGGRPPLPPHRFVSYVLAVLTTGAKSGRPPD